LCRWLAAGKTFLAATSLHDATQQQQHDSTADTTLLSAADRRLLRPASEYDTQGHIHWSVLQFKQQLQQQQEAAAAAEAAKASKKRPASATGGGGGSGFGGLGGKEAKKLAAELAAGSGGQWWYVPGVGDGEQQVGQGLLLAWINMHYLNKLVLSLFRLNGLLLSLLEER
jgi:hypothetical protein